MSDCLYPKNIQPVEFVQPLKGCVTPPVDPGTGTVEISNWDEMPLGIEASLAANACVYDLAGEVVGKTFICKVVDEETGAITFDKLFSGYGLPPVTYDPLLHGTEGACEQDSFETVIGSCVLQE